jgi:hypothetical protein
MRDFTGGPNGPKPPKCPPAAGASGPPRGPQIIGVHPGGTGSSAYDPRTGKWTPVTGPTNLGNNLTGHPNGSVTWSPPGGLDDPDN